MTISNKFLTKNLKLSIHSQINSAILDYFIIAVLITNKILYLFCGGLESPSESIHNTVDNLNLDRSSVTQLGLLRLLLCHG